MLFALSGVLQIKAVHKPYLYAACRCRVFDNIERAFSERVYAWA